jgi:hypothetical protein
MIVWFGAHIISFMRLGLALIDGDERNLLVACRNARVRVERQIPIDDEDVSVGTAVQRQTSHPPAAGCSAHTSSPEVPPIKITDEPDAFSRRRFTGEPHYAVRATRRGMLPTRSSSMTRLCIHTVRSPLQRSCHGLASDLSSGFTVFCVETPC